VVDVRLLSSALGHGRDSKQELAHHWNEGLPCLLSNRSLDPTEFKFAECWKIAKLERRSKL
jgi:hypothetical protein